MRSVTFGIPKVAILKVQNVYVAPIMHSVNSLFRILRYFNTYSHVALLDVSAKATWINVYCGYSTGGLFS